MYGAGGKSQVIHSRGVYFSLLWLFVIHFDIVVGVPRAGGSRTLTRI